MLFSTAPEMTTALTCAMLALVSFFFALRLRAESRRSLRARLWLFALSGSGAAALLGVPAHALRSIAGVNPPDPAAQTLYWAVLGAFFFFSASAIGVAALTELRGEYSLGRSAKTFAALGGASYALYFIIAALRLMEGYFAVFIAYSGAVMIFSLAAFTWLFIRRSDRRFMFTAAAILVSAAASALQASRGVSFTLVWLFDYNSVYHLLLMPAAWLYYLGAKRSLS